SHRYLPRRRAAATVRPVSWAAISAAPARYRRTERGCVTVTDSTVRPHRCSARPRRTTSTSGSSGTSGFAGQCAVGGARCLLLRFLLRPSDTLPVGIAGDHGGRGELFVVVGPGGSDLIAGHAQTAFGGQFLQAGLEVQPSAHSWTTFEQFGEQPQHDLTRHIDTVLEMHGTEQRLH